jgi:hypothetical protein
VGGASYHQLFFIIAEAAQLKAGRAELTSKPLQNLPVTPGRSYQNLFRTPPGVTSQEDEGQKSQPSNLMPGAFF